MEAPLLQRNFGWLSRQVYLLLGNINFSWCLSFVLVFFWFVFCSWNILVSHSKFFRLIFIYRLKDYLFSFYIAIPVHTPFLFPHWVSDCYTNMPATMLNCNHSVRIHNLKFWFLFPGPAHDGWSCKLWLLNWDRRYMLGGQAQQVFMKLLPGTKNHFFLYSFHKLKISLDGVLTLRAPC